MVGEVGKEGVVVDHQLRQGLDDLEAPSESVLVGLRGLRDEPLLFYLVCLVDVVDPLFDVVEDQGVEGA